jgi:hypothetical protein
MDGCRNRYFAPTVKNKPPSLKYYWQIQQFRSWRPAFPGTGTVPFEALKKEF